MRVIFGTPIEQDSNRRADDRRFSLNGFAEKNLYSDNYLKLSLAAGRNYPIIQYNLGRAQVLIEGMIYNKTETEIRLMLEKVVSRFLADSNYLSSVESMINDCDGEYWIVIYFTDRSELLLFGDYWGRLPSFYYSDHNRFIFSRNMDFILENIPAIKINKYALAEILSLEYNLGEKTYFTDVRRAEPASCFHAGFLNGKVISKQFRLFPPDFRTSFSGMPYDKAVAAAYELFLDSLKNRVDKLQSMGRRFIVDLSGGYDTRAVFAAVRKITPDFKACHDLLFTADESKIASALARYYQAELICLKAEHPADNISEINKVNYITDGLINSLVNISCFYNGLKRQASITDESADFMGLGGEFLRNVYQDKYPYGGFTEMLMDDAFTHFIRIHDAGRLLNLSGADMYDVFKDEVSRFPEGTRADRVRHLFYEYYRKITTAGEDRHRLYIWTVTPFWGRELIDLVTRKLPASYIDLRFYLRFLKLIDKDILKIPFYGMNYPLENRLFYLYALFREEVKRKLRDNRYVFKFFKRLRGMNQPQGRANADVDLLSREMLNICGRSDLIKSIFNLKYLAEYIGNKANRLQFYQLMTVITYLDEIERRFTGKIYPKT